MCLRCLKVKDDRTGVAAEWLVGKIGTKEGLFPEAFVQPAPSISSEEQLEPADNKPTDASFGMSSVFASNSKR